MALKSQTSTQTAQTTKPAEQPEASGAEETALVLMQTAGIVEIPQPTSNSDLLPMMKMVHPIETGGDSLFKVSDAYKIGLFDGSKFVPLEAPYTLTILSSRLATRKLITQPDGKKKYERAFKAIGKCANSDAKYQAHLSDPMAEKGASYVLGLIQGEKVAIVELPVFKVNCDYWTARLNQAIRSNRLGCKVLITDHSVNLITGKDPSKKYLGPKKFVQTELVELTEREYTLTGEAFMAVKDKFVAWLER